MSETRVDIQEHLWRSCALTSDSFLLLNGMLSDLSCSIGDGSLALWSSGSHMRHLWFTSGSRRQEDAVNNLAGTTQTLVPQASMLSRPKFQFALTRLHR